MGREWLYKSSRGGDGSGGKSPSTAGTTTAIRINGKTRKEKKKNNNNNNSSGCMSAIFNLFDIQHHHQFRFNHPSFISESTIINHQQSNLVLQGVEAPRNSLESPESDMDVLGSSSKVKKQSNLSIPIGGIQIKTQRSRFTEDISSAECSSSPGTKTPSLVARLMGLDILPEYSSPRASSSSTPATSYYRSRSLPTTPRVSTTSRRSTENKDYHHRLSLQIDKENFSTCRNREHESLQMKMLRRRSECLVTRKDGGCSDYAEEITNQVRERISRRLGTDITNIMSSTIRNKEHRRDSNLVLLKPKKPHTSAQVPILTHVSVQTPVSSKKAKQDYSMRFSSSQELRLLDIKNNFNKPISNSKPSKSKPVKDEKINRIVSERYDLRLKKSTSLPNYGVKNVKNTTKFHLVKKELTSLSSTRLPQKQVSLVKLPSSLNSPYKENDIFTTTTAAAIAASGDSFSDNDHFDYISRILNQCGIQTTSCIYSGQWYSPNHPLHPSIFNELEKRHHSTTTDTARRRMIFELVNEFLVEILKPYLNQKPWMCTRQYYNLENVIPPASFTMCGSELIVKLCNKIASFPIANCEGLDDIDRLIDTDMRRSMFWSSEFATDEIVKEIENEIMESLVHEMQRELLTK